MARKSASNVTAPNQTDTNTKQESNRMPLNPDQIAALLADNRGRGDYATYLKEFVDSGSAGEEVNLSEGLLAGKTADKAKTGLENAKKARTSTGELKNPGIQNVLVVKKDDHVFVINRDISAGE